MRRSTVAVLALSLAACGGDSTPLPALKVGAEWMPLMMDTTGNLMMRRMAMWVDTVNVGTSPAGFAQTLERMQMDMKMGGISTTLRTRLEVDCATKRYRSSGLDSVAVSANGKPMPDSVAKQVIAQQEGKLSDTTWRAGESLGDGKAVTAICARVPAAGPK